MSTRTARLAAVPALVLAAGLTLAACGSNDPIDIPVTPVPSPQTPTETTAPDDDTTPDDDDAPDEAPDDDTDVDDVTAAALRAIATAEAEIGGMAYAVDDRDDDDTWDIEIAFGDRSIEVEISADGGSVIGRDDEDELDDDERRALDAVEVTLSQAITSVVTESGGVLDEADLDDDSDVFHWDISVTLPDDSGADFTVDLATGDVARG